VRTGGEESLLPGFQGERATGLAKPEHISGKKLSDVLFSRRCNAVESSGDRVESTEPPGLRPGSGKEQ
jgi:hypothetical protein